MTISKDMITLKITIVPNKPCIYLDFIDSLYFYI